MRNALDPFIPRHTKLQEAWFHLFSAVEEGSLVVRVPEFDGSFEFGIRSDILRSLMVFREFEARLAEIVKERVDPARDVIDIGANIGLFTILMAGLIVDSRKVLAIEPTPGALKYLLRNIERNARASKVVVFNGVAAEAAKQYQMNILDGREEYSSLGMLVLPGLNQVQSSQILVPGETIDDLVDKFGLRPGFIKMDTEGSECRVLSGSRHTIQKYRPIILSECSDLLLGSSGADSQMLTGFLRSYDYAVEFVTSGEILAIPNELADIVPAATRDSSCVTKS